MVIHWYLIFSDVYDLVWCVVVREKGEGIAGPGADFYFPGPAWLYACCRAEEGQP